MACIKVLGLFGKIKYTFSLVNILYKSVTTIAEMTVGKTRYTI